MNPNIPLDSFQSEIKDFLANMQDELAEFNQRTFVGTADDGRIAATVGSAGHLQEISIHVLAKRRNDKITLSELVLEAIRNAQYVATTAREDLMSQQEIFGISVQELFKDPQGAARRLMGRRIDQI
jgi:DNA-binding protein YbaB